MLLKQCDWPPSAMNSTVNSNSVFEMIITPELEYPIVCAGVSKSSFGSSGLKLELINTNSGKMYLKGNRKK